MKIDTANNNHGPRSTTPGEYNGRSHVPLKNFYPGNDLLTRVLPAHLWERARNMALQGDLYHFNIGTVIFDPVTNEVISEGHSRYLNKEETLTIHAEADAIQRAGDKTHGTDIVLVNLSRAGNWAYSARPCAACARALGQAGVRFVHYAHRTELNTWVIHTERVIDLVEAAEDIPITKYACRMKVPLRNPLRIVGE